MFLRAMGRAAVLCLHLFGCAPAPASGDAKPLPSFAFAVRSNVAAPLTVGSIPRGSYLLQSLEDSTRGLRFDFFASEPAARRTDGELYHLVLRTSGAAPLPTHAVFAEWQLESTSTAREFEQSRAELFSLRAEHLESFHADLLFQSLSEPRRYLILGLYLGEEGLQLARGHPQIRASAEQNPPSRFGARDLYGVRNFRILRP